MICEHHLCVFVDDLGCTYSRKNGVYMCLTAGLRCNFSSKLEFEHYSVLELVLLRMCSVKETVLPFVSGVVVKITT